MLTVAAATVAAIAGTACGGTVADETRGDARDPESGPGPGCPATQPVGPTACISGLECHYTWCPYNGGYWQGESKCIDGKWSSSGTSCNPPPPPSECPGTEPRPGSSCAVFASSCAYADTCAPERGYPDYLSCVGGKWELRDNYLAPCPAKAPAHGTSCLCGGAHLSPPTCRYADSCGPDNTVATCDPTTGTWSVGISTCNPPFDAGPTEAGIVDVGVTDAGASD